MNTPADLAEELGVDRRTVLEWRLRHGWESVQIGRQIYFTDEQFAAIIAKHTVKPKVKPAAEQDSPAGPVRIDGQTKRSARRLA